MTPLGPQLRALRQKAGLRQIDLVTAGVGGQSTISEIENDTRPTTTDVLERYITKCGGDVQIILPGSQTEDTPRLVAAWQTLSDDERETYLDIIEARAKRSKEKG